jgi:excisionase family DNA binding protein
MLSVEGAARLLGVNSQRVRVLISNRRLPAQKVGRDYALDPGVVAAFARQDRASGRPMSARNAWALLAALCGRGYDHDISSRSRDRLKALLRQDSDSVVKALAHSQRRSNVHAWRVLPVDVSRLLGGSEQLVRNGLAADHKAIDIRYDAERDGLDAYVSADRLHELERRLQPSVDSKAANLLLRVPIERSWILDEDVAPLSVAAADLLSHDDERVRRAGIQALREMADADRDS